MTRVRPRPLPIATLLAALCAWPMLGAAAEPPSATPAVEPSAATPGAEPTDADGWFQRGVEAYKAEQLAEAERCLAKAWALKRTYDIAGNYGQTLFKLGKMRDAAEVLSVTLASFPPTAGADKRQRVEQMLADASQHVGRVHLEVVPDGAIVRVDGKELGKAPVGPELFLEPGPHVIEATAPGRRTVSANVDAVAGGSQPLKLVLVEEASLVPASPSSPAEEGSGAAPWVAGIGFGLGGAGLIAAIALTAAANGKAGDFADATASLDALGKSCPEGSADADCVAARDADGSRVSLSNAALGVWIGTGVVLAATAVVTTALSVGNEPGEAAAVSLAPLVAPTGGGLGVSGRF